jgi:peptidoglycan/LPS O-acetylase OafA/YrhL
MKDNKMTDITDIDNSGKRKNKSYRIERHEPLMRISPDNERYHSALDLGYFIAAWIGFFSTIFVLVTFLGEKPLQAAFYFNAIITFLLFVNGALGFYFHYRRKMLSELITLPSVIIGMVFILVAYVLQTIHLMVHDETVSVATGLSGALLTMFIVYLTSRYRFILKVIKEAKINRNLVEKIEAK